MATPPDTPANRIPEESARPLDIRPHGRSRNYPWVECGSRLKEARLREGLTQVAVARAVGVHPQTLWYWEAGQYLPSGTNLKKLASLLRVSIDWIFGHQAEIPQIDPALRAALPGLDEQQLNRVSGFIEALKDGTGLERPQSSEDP